MTSTSEFRPETQAPLIDDGGPAEVTDGIDSKSVGVPICPVCGSPEAGLPLVVCPDCETPHHRECWMFNGGCGIYACACVPIAERNGAAPVVIDEKGASLVVTLWSTWTDRCRTVRAVGSELMDRGCAWLTHATDGPGAAILLWIIVLTLFLRYLAHL